MSPVGLAPKIRKRASPSGVSVMLGVIHDGLREIPHFDHHSLITVFCAGSSVLRATNGPFLTRCPGKVEIL